MAERSPEHGTADGKPAVKYARLSDPYRGELIGERYWEPFHRDSLHRMYSITKSFTSLATGLLAAEGKIGLDDRICTYFRKAAGGWRTSMVRRNDDPGFTYDAYLL